MAVELLDIEVAYATAQQQVVIPVQLPAGTTLEQGIRASGILEQFPEIDLQDSNVGIFGQLSAPDTILSNADRIEIYRPLSQSPMEARRNRFLQGAPRKPGQRNSVGGQNRKT
jgi:putative ubiquitin-RnfH superfamily antitoxin RatB of RatAB toxin-antitoxin module